MVSSAKNILETGRLPDTVNAFGRKVPGKEVSPEELIPLYINEVAEEWEGFPKEEAEQRFMRAYQNNGKKGLLDQLKLVPTFARNLL